MLIFYIQTTIVFLIINLIEELFCIYSNMYIYMKIEQSLEESNCLEYKKLGTYIC